MMLDLPDAALQASLELLRSHATASPTGGDNQSPPEAQAELSPHAYGDIGAVAGQQGRPGVDVQQQQPQPQPKEEDYIHPDLRGPSSAIMPTANHLAPAAHMIPSSNLQLPPLPQADVAPAPVVDQQMLAPAPAPVAVAPQQAPPIPQPQEEAGSRRGKRELSQSKRAAQNRAAQVRKFDSQFFKRRRITNCLI